MGYFVDLEGEFTINPSLKDDIKELINGLAQTRRVKRENDILKQMGYDGDFGVEGEFFIEDTIDKSIIDMNVPPIRQPGLWCHWETDEKGEKLIPTGKQFYHSADWIKYIIESILKPNGYIVNGVVKGKIHNDDFTITIKDNNVFVNGDYDYAYDDGLWNGNQITLYEVTYRSQQSS